MLEKTKVPESMEFQAIQVTTLNSFFNELNESSHNYCVLRNFDKLPFYIGNDLDLLVSDEDLTAIVDKAKKIMHDNGFILKNSVNRLGHFGMCFQHVKHKKSIAIDLLTKCVKFWYDYADCEYILGTKVKYKNFYVPLKGNICYTIVLKDLLTYGFVRSKNDALRHTISEQDRMSFLMCGRDFISEGLLHSLFDDIDRGRLESNRVFLYCQLLKKFSLSNFVTYVHHRLREVLVK